MTIGENIKASREKMNISRKELSLKMNVSQQMIYKWENGKSNPKLSTIRRISTALSVPMSELIGEHWGLFTADEIKEDWAGDDLKEIAEPYRKLNATGKTEAVKRVEELTYIDKYTRKE